MNFYPYGPFEIPRNGKLVSRDKTERKAFWEEVEGIEEGLSDACGCYVFTINGKAWYVGMAEKQSFYAECFGMHKIVQYNEAMQGIKGKPQLILLAKLTPQDRFSKPSKRGHWDIRALESMLIGLAVSRNPELCNVKGTKHLREMHVPGLLNTGKGVAKATSVRAFKDALGI